MTRELLACCAIYCCGLPAAFACEGHSRIAFDKPTVLEGVLQSGKGNHEAQGAFSYVYIALDKPVCVDAGAAAPGDEDSAQSIEAPVTRIQLAGEAIGDGASLPIGKHVSVEGTLFAAHTMWHAEDVLIDAAEVQPR